MVTDVFDKVVEPLPKTLVIGDFSAFTDAEKSLPEIDGFVFAAAEDLVPSLVRKIAPEMILSSIVSGTMDVIEIARKLAQMKYAGAYRVLARHLPRPELVIQEVKLVAPDIDFDLIALADIFPDISNGS